MKTFHRTKRDSKILGFIGLVFALFMSVIFMSLGFHTVAGEDKASFEVIFEIVGVIVFIIFIRGAWMMTGGSLVHVFSIDQKKVIWGFLGKEKELNICEMSSIYWNDSDGFTLTMTKKNGHVIRFPYIENIISHKGRGELLKFFRDTLRAIPIEGHISRKIEDMQNKTLANITQPFNQ